MTNITNQVAALPPQTDITQVLAAEVNNGKALLNTVLTWFTERGLSFAVNVLVALLLLVIGAYLIRLLTDATRKTLEKTGRVNTLLQHFLCSVVNKSAWVLLLMVILQRLNVNIAPLIAGLGVTGFILGFAFQESLGNLAAGMMIALNQPFKVGDYVLVGGIEGIVRELNMMATTLTTADNKKVVVPNKVVWGTAITNFTAMEQRRVDVGVGVAYGADLVRAKQVALDVLRAHPLVLKDPAPAVEVMQLGDSSVNLVLRPWGKPDDYWTIYFGITQAVKEAFDKNGVEIPFPQLDVHMKGGPVQS